jgi:23S rRNA pseudouridine1911/1915/1917 synthase
LPASETNPDLSPQPFELVPTPGESGVRLDVFLAGRLRGWSRSRLQRLIRSGFVQLGARVARKAGEELRPGDRVIVRLAEAPLRAQAEDLPLAIVYEDDDLLVVNKPAGMVVHAGAGVSRGTLVNALLYHTGRLSATGGAERPGIVHRLDKNTSGLILIAKNDAAHQALAAAFKARAIQKTYWALVHGRLSRDEGEMAAPIGRDPFRRVRMSTGGIRPREASTRFRVLRRLRDFTLLEVSPQTGRTHQIRVHLAWLGHPVVGDTLYGAPSRIRIRGKEEKTLTRTFLHAAALEFRHPRTGQRTLFRAPLPPDLAQFLEHVSG